MASSGKLPARMTAIAISEPGGPRVLKPEKRDLPELREGEILIQVRAAGVNRPDVLQRKGALSAAAGRLRPARPRGGRRGGGARATGVKRWRIGDAVCALTPGGGYAEYCRVHETQCAAGTARASPSPRPARCPRPSSPSGTMCSSAAR